MLSRCIWSRRGVIARVMAIGGALVVLSWAAVTSGLTSSSPVRLRRSGIVDEQAGERHDPGAGIRYPMAQRNGLRMSRPLAFPTNVNVMSKKDVVQQETINGTKVFTCNPGKQTAQNEFSVAVNPSDPNNLVAGANDYRLHEASENRYDGSGGFYRSINGGKSWTAGFLPGLVRGNAAAPGPYQSAGDPAIAAGPNNVFWYANIAFNRDDNACSIAVSRSADGGKKWTTRFVIQEGASSQVFHDKEWIAAHPTDPNVAWVTWTRFASTSPIVYSRTTDGGDTWSSPALVTTRSYNQGSVIWIDTKGRAHVVWENFSNSGASSMMYARSSGGTFQNWTLAPVADIEIYWAYFRNNSFPTFAMDGNTLHVAWSNWNGTDADIVYMRSTNGGNTWSAPVTVVGDASDQFFPWIGARNGVVAIGYQDHQGDKGQAFHASIVGSTDGGATWSAPLTLSTADSNPQRGNLFGFPDCSPAFIGDYNGMAVDSLGRAHPFWVDIRNGNSPGDPGSTADQDPYTSAVTFE